MKNETYSSLNNKTIAITGSTGGLAIELCKNLAKLNSNLILINRNKEKTEQQIEQLKAINPNLNIQFYICDLEDFESVKETTQKLQQQKIDILYLCAGAYNIPRKITSLNYDNVFQINFVSQYYIAKELLKNIKEVNGKIVAVSSIAHNYSKFDENDTDFSKQKKHSRVYGNAKRFLTFALMELREQENFNLSIVHPGLTLTEMTNHYPKAINWLVKIFIGLFCPSVKQATSSLLNGIFEDTNYHEWIGPRMLQIYGKPKKIKLKTCSENESKKIFNVAEMIYENIKKEDV